MNTQYNAVGLADMKEILLEIIENVLSVDGNIMDIMENMSHHMMNSSGIYSTMIQEVNIPSGMLMPELGKVGPYYKYVQWCNEHLMDYQKDFLKRMEEQQWTDEILLRNQY